MITIHCQLFMMRIKRAGKHRTNYMSPFLGRILVIIFSLFLSGCKTFTTMESPISDLATIRFVSPIAAKSTFTPTMQITVETGVPLTPTILCCEPTTLIHTLTPTATKQFSYSEHPSMFAFTMKSGGKKAIFVAQPDGIKLQRLMGTPEISFDPWWSPDGRYIAFLGGETEDTATLHVLDFINNQVRFLEQGNILSKTWSPNSRYLAFVSDGEGLERLFIYDLETDQVELIEQIGITDFTWSPNSREIVFITGFVKDNQYLYKFNLTNKKLEELATIQKRIFVYGLQWSPLGDLIMVYIQPARHGEVYGQIILGTFSLQGELMFLNLGSAIHNATWFPDGQHILFCGWDQEEMGGNPLPYEIAIVNPDGTNEQEILKTPNLNIAYCSLSPGGDYVAFDTQGPQSGVYLIELESGEVNEIASPELNGEIQTWSPNGMYLAFTTRSEYADEEAGTLNIYSRATGEVKQILENALDWYIAWRP